VAYALLTQQPVRTNSRISEITPAASIDAGGVPFIAWAQNSRAHPRHYDAYLKHGTDPSIRLNTVGQGYMGGIDPPNVVYQQIRRGQSSIRFYDIDSATRPAAPAGVNTANWEWRPSISGDWLLFGRSSVSSPAQAIRLHNVMTSEQRSIATASSSRRTILWPGQVNGDWVVYSRCNPVCSVFRYNITAETTVAMQKPATTRPRWQYAPSVSSDGTVYLARSGSGCGALGVKIVRYGLSDPATGRVVAGLGAGRDTQFSYARDNTDGSVDVFYDRYTCSTGRADIYRVNDS
jgi:hypothetical protein